MKFDSDFGKFQSNFSPISVQFRSNIIWILVTECFNPLLIEID